MQNLAPIILFVYNRPEHTKKTVQALQVSKLASESDLHIFSDAPKNDKAVENVKMVRDYISNITGFKSVIIVERETNFGLAKSIITGVTQIIETAGKAIVIEDDLIVTPNFLVYMNSSLEKYILETKVFSICGFSFNLPIKKSETNTYFLNRGWPWGWATWKDRWDLVDWDIKDYAKFLESKSLQKKFNKGGSDLTSMLKKQMNGELDSWAIRWFYNQFKIGGLTLYPSKSKVLNDGFGEGATHTTGSNRRYKPILDMGEIEQFYFPEKVEVDSYYQKLFQSKMGIFSRIKSRLESEWMNIIKIVRNSR